MATLKRPSNYPGNAAKLADQMAGLYCDDLARHRFCEVEKSVQYYVGEIALIIKALRAYKPPRRRARTK
jgi:hypothetical protein